MSGPGFSVIDFETTGLFPGGRDRVIEVAVVHLSPEGCVTGRWDTLVNPGRDLGPQHIHHVRAIEVLEAPAFAQIAPRLVELLSGRVLVAHNASFDVRFLLAELARSGYSVGLPIESLCTMRLAREFLPGAGRSLSDCCAAVDIEIEGAHRAAVDASATAQLLNAYLLANPTWSGWEEHLARAAPAWPPLAGAEVRWYPRDTPRADPTSFLERMSIRLPEVAGPAEHQEYLALLDRCLLDRELSAHEADALVALAEDLGMNPATCARLHLQYFADLTALAWADGNLSATEIADLVAVAGLLRIPEATLAEARQPAKPQAVPARVAFQLQPGDLIVLTGEMSRSRDDWHSELRARGFVPHPAVTKKVKLVVAADTDSL